MLALKIFNVLSFSYLLIVTYDEQLSPGFLLRFIYIIVQINKLKSNRLLIDHPFKKNILCHSFCPENGPIIGNIRTQINLYSELLQTQ